jgi:hypothetical protein
LHERGEHAQAREACAGREELGGREVEKKRSGFKQYLQMTASLNSNRRHSFDSSAAYSSRSSAFRSKRTTQLLEIFLSEYLGVVLSMLNVQQREP